MVVVEKGGETSKMSKKLVVFMGLWSILLIGGILIYNSYVKADYDSRKKIVVLNLGEDVKIPTLRLGDPYLKYCGMVEDALIIAEQDISGFPFFGTETWAEIRIPAKIHSVFVIDKVHYRIVDFTEYQVTLEVLKDELRP